MRSAFAAVLFASLLGAPATAGNAPSKSPQAVDGDAAYKANCMRCHTAIHTYAPGSMRTMILHMRVKANITKDQADAIFRYMTGDDKDPKIASANSEQRTLSQ